MAALQDRIKFRVERFFANPDSIETLRSIVSTKIDVLSCDWFVRHKCKNSQETVRAPDGTMVHPYSAYRTNVRSYRKKNFDALSMTKSPLSVHGVELSLSQWAFFLFVCETGIGAHYVAHRVELIEGYRAWKKETIRKYREQFHNKDKPKKKKKVRGADAEICRVMTANVVMDV